MTGAYNRQIFFDNVRAAPFAGNMSNSQVQGMTALLDYIDHLVWHPDTPESAYFNYWNAYSFATSFHETAYTMQPVTEYGSNSYLMSKPYWPYIGRGFVQMTWETNYQRSDEEIESGNLIADPSRFPGGIINQHGLPDQALDLEVAACNLMVGCWKGWWTGRKYWDYLTLDVKDYWNARRIVNGTDKASQIEGYAENFETAFVNSWQEEPVEVPPPELPPPMPEPGPELPPELEPPSGRPDYPQEILDKFAATGASEIRVEDNQLTLVYLNPL